MKRPMLAATLPKGSYPRFPCYVSVKLDGIRAIVLGGKVYSRSMKLLPSPDIQRLFGRPELEGLDGEIILGDPTAPLCFNRTSSVCMTKALHPAEVVARITFFVFDAYTPGLFSQRQKTVAIAAAKGVPQVVHLHQEKVETPEHFDELEADAVAKGHEGIIVRSPDGPYKEGRSTLGEGYLLKVKRFERAEAKIIGMEEMMRNDNVAYTNEVGRTARSSAKAGKTPAGTMGKLIVQDLVDNVVFRIGTGFDMKLRNDFWAAGEQANGLICVYKAMEHGRKDKPRSGVYIGIRDPRDM